jgi:hypothetical protein
MKNYVFVWILLILTGCATTPNEHREFFKEVLSFRDGYKGLTNKICVDRRWDDKCLNWSISEYSLENPEVRKGLIDMSFVCKVAGRRFKIDPDQPGLARYKEDRPCWLCKKETTIVERISLKDNLPYLIAAATICYSQNFYTDGMH